jgi:hypothetical protein|tara:strand:- start:41 stop:754 length:714 start_codon:yes stop_codon:yes gene_type:complete
MGFIGVQPASVPLTASDITDGIITSAKIADGTIATADIADSAVTLAKTSGVGGDLSFGGDTFGADKIIGSNDAYALSFETNNVVGLKIDANGHVTKPKNSLFKVEQTGALSVADGHTLFSTNTNEAYDVNADVSGGTFTAPVDGYYLFTATVLYQGIGSSDTDVVEDSFQSSNKNETMSRHAKLNNALSTGGYLQTWGSTILYMDANDTCFMKHEDGGTLAVHASAKNCYFNGCLLQ